MFKVGKGYGEGAFLPGWPLLATYTAPGRSCQHLNVATLTSGCH